MQWSLDFEPKGFLPAQRGWPGVCHMLVLYQNGHTYLKTFTTTW